MYSTETKQLTKELNQMEKSNHTLNLAIALLIGVAIGGTLGVLYAPDKGSKTRKKITDGTHDITDSIKNKFNNLVDVFQEEVETIKDKGYAYFENNDTKSAKLTAKL